MFKSGPSLDGSSGNVTILTDNSASLGVSGAVNISTGRLRASGDVVLSPGPLRKSHGGNILLEVGSAGGGQRRGGGWRQRDADRGDLFHNDL